MSMTIVTPSFAPDFAGFERLHASVLRYTEVPVRHMVIVPNRDVRKFSRLASPRLEVVSERDVLPRRIVLTSALARIPRIPRGFRMSAINLRRPWPPIRGWILQQLLKFSVVSMLSDDVVLLIDSDVQIIRPLKSTIFRRDDGVVRVFRQPFGIAEDMRRHLGWRRAAARLLDIAPEDDSPDYISSFTSWNPALVRGCLSRIARTQNHNWLDCLGGELDFSEFIIYGSFVMSLADPEHRSFVSDRSLCHSYWDSTPLTEAAALDFLAGISPSDVAILVQSNSGTSDAVRRMIDNELEKL